MTGMYQETEEKLLKLLRKYKREECTAGVVLEQLTKVIRKQERYLFYKKLKQVMK